jgi:hypothetical protein
MRVLGRHLRHAKERAHRRRAGPLPLLPRAGSPRSLVEITESRSRRGAPVASLFVVPIRLKADTPTRNRLKADPM